MSIPVNPKYFDKMVDEDIVWLKENLPESVIFIDHIESCLEMAKKYYREVLLPSKPESELDC